MFEISGLSFTYRAYGTAAEHAPVLCNLDLTVHEGQSILILGAPDSGKSTLARIMCALVPRFVEGDLEGSITFQGERIDSRGPWELTDRCTLVAQNPQEQLLMTTCADEVAFPLESLGVRRERLVSSVHSALHRWELDRMMEVNPQELSGGERKRLLLAVTDAIGAPVWVMDEPFDDLDEFWRAHLLSEIEKKEGTVIVFASRYLEEFRGSFDAYYLLDQGVLTAGDEEAIVLAFDRVSDVQFSVKSTLEHVPEHDSHTLVAQNLSIVHPRRSVSSTEPFTLRAPDFRIASGEVVALVGPNGSGKSTLSRVLCGLDPSATGSISFDTAPCDRRMLRSRVGYLFQNPDFGIFLPTVREELGWSLRHVPALAEEQREQLIEKTARLFHLSCEDNPTTMSYGARKQLQAAVYYILNRPFYIVDELDSGVTYAAAFEIVSLLRSRGAGIVLITHDSAFARNIAERTYTIDNGVVKERRLNV